MRVYNTINGTGDRRARRIVVSLDPTRAPYKCARSSGMSAAGLKVRPKIPSRIRDRQRIDPMPPPPRDELHMESRDEI